MHVVYMQEFLEWLSTVQFVRGNALGLLWVDAVNVETKLVNCHSWKEITYSELQRMWGIIHKLISGLSVLFIIHIKLFH